MCFRYLIVPLTAVVLVLVGISSAQAQFGNRLRDRLGNAGKTEALLDAASDAVIALRMTDSDIAQLGADCAGVGQ